VKHGSKHLRPRQKEQAIAGKTPVHGSNARILTKRRLKGGASELGLEFFHYIIHMYIFFTFAKEQTKENKDVMIKGNNKNQQSIPFLHSLLLSSSPGQACVARTALPSLVN
jgi:hypothetical protein